MAAGLGFKDFTTGEVLTAADVDGYLMQGVWVFASAAARDAAVTSPQEGNFAYLKDTNTTTYYTGSAWTNLDTTGMVNPMTTTGDTIYSSSGSTPARLGIGSTGQVLTVAAGIPSWATPGGSGANWSLLNSGGTTLSGTNVSITGISGADKIMVLIANASITTAGIAFGIRINSDSGSNYYQYGQSDLSEIQQASNKLFVAYLPSSTTASGGITLTGCNSSGVKAFQSISGASGAGEAYSLQGYYNSSSTISSVQVYADGFTFGGGTVYVYTSA
jgi:hypothetical protein